MHAIDFSQYTHLYKLLKTMLQQNLCFFFFFYEFMVYLEAKK